MPRKKKDDLLVEATKAAVIAHVRDGVPISMVGDLVGKSKSTIMAWQAADQGFRIGIFKARNEILKGSIRNVLDSKDWRAHAWYAERQCPEEFAAPMAIERILKQYGLIPDDDAGTSDSGQFARSVASDSSSGTTKV